jgi:hypothetical protein
MLHLSLFVGTQVSVPSLDIDTNTRYRFVNLRRVMRIPVSILSRITRHKSNDDVFTLSKTERFYFQITNLPCVAVAMQWSRDKPINNSVMKTISRLQLGKHVPAAMNSHATVELLLETAFYTRLVKSGYNQDHWGYNGTTLFLGYIYIYMRTWPSRLGESRIRDSEMWSWVPQDADLRMTALATTSSNCKRQIRPLVREDVT